MTSFLMECFLVLAQNAISPKSFRRCLKTNTMAEQGYIAKIKMRLFRDTFDNLLK